jgi:carbon starvation protein
VIDPLGGINTLWPLFGIANQMLAGIALVLCTCVLFKMKRAHFACVTIVPAGWVVACTLIAAWQKIFDPNPRVGFLAHADLYTTAIAKEVFLAPANSMEQMQQVIFNDYVNALLTVMFMLVLISILLYSLKTISKTRGPGGPTAKEALFRRLPATAPGAAAAEK